MSVLLRYQRAPGAPWEEAILRGDPFEICNKVQERLFPGRVLPQRDERFEAMMAARETRVRAGQGPSRERDDHLIGAAASTTLPGAGVRDTSILAYRSIEASGKLSRQQKHLVEFMAANLQRDYTRQELKDATGLGINVICGRVHELVELGALEECGRRECRVTGETANALRLVAAMRKAA